MTAHTFRGKVVEIPSGIDELTPEQYVFYLHLTAWLRARAVTPRMWLRRWAACLAGLGEVNPDLLREEFREQFEELEAAVERAFLIRNDAGEPMPETTSCRNLLPFYKGFKGPGDWLDGMTFGSFTKCAALIEQARTAIDSDAADIYAEIAREIYAIPEGERVPQVLVWHAPALFVAVSRAIQSEPVDINGKPVDFGIIFRPAPVADRRPDDNTGWAGVAFEVAASGIFGNMRELENAPLWDVLLYLYKCKFEYLHEKSKKK